MKEQGMVHEACKWCYRGVWGVLTQYFHLPDAPPTLPSMEGEEIEKYHPSQAFLEYQKFFFWIGLFAVDIVLTGLWIGIAVAFPLVGLLITPLALALIVLPDIVAYIAIHLRYDTTWYVLSDRSLRIRRGIWTIHETTITFENIQNIMMQQGPIQRWFGFANLVVKTAGGGNQVEGATLGAHVGILEGLSNADELRERILSRTRRCTGAGLGDEHPEEYRLTMAGGPITQGIQGADSIRVLQEIRDIANRLAA